MLKQITAKEAEKMLEENRKRVLLQQCEELVSEFYEELYLALENLRDSVVLHYPLSSDNIHILLAFLDYLRLQGFICTLRKSDASEIVRKNPNKTTKVTLVIEF